METRVRLLENIKCQVFVGHTRDYHPRTVDNGRSGLWAQRSMDTVNYGHRGLRAQWTMGALDTALDDMMSLLRQGSMTTFFQA